MPTVRRASGAPSRSRAGSPSGRSTAAPPPSTPASSPSPSRSTRDAGRETPWFRTGGGEAEVGRSAKSRAPGQAAPPTPASGSRAPVVGASIAVFSFLRVSSYGNVLVTSLGPAAGRAADIGP